MSIENEILKEVSDYLGDDLFLVDLSVNSSKKINLLIDSNEGIKISECVKISKSIRKKLEDRLDEYELNVSSPGVDQPFKVEKQYAKNIGRDIEIVLLTGEKRKGKLLNYKNDRIEIEETKKVKKENSTKKETLIEIVDFETKNVKSTKLVLKFK